MSRSWREFQRSLGLDPDAYYPWECDVCGRDAKQPGLVDVVCLNRCCVWWHCPHCGADTGSGFGAPGCRCQYKRSPGPNPLSIDGAALTRRYRARKKRR